MELSRNGNSVTCHETCTSLFCRSFLLKQFIYKIKHYNIIKCMHSCRFIPFTNDQSTAIKEFILVSARLVAWPLLTEHISCVPNLFISHFPPDATDWLVHQIPRASDTSSTSSLNQQLPIPSYSCQNMLCFVSKNPLCCPWKKLLYCVWKVSRRERNYCLSYLTIC